LGKVLISEPGSPAGTVAAVQKLVDGQDQEKNKTDEKTGEVELPKEEAPVTEAPAASTTAENKEHVATADVAADVADMAAKLDGDVKA
jgi:hypothetical protein